MARLLFLPNRDSVVLFDLPYPADELIERIDAGFWYPPEPYRSIIAAYPGRLLRANLGGLVVVYLADAASVGIETSKEEKRLILKPRERILLETLAEGLSTQVAANRLSVSKRTIARLTLSLKQRFGVRTIAQTVARAQALGLVKMRKK